MRVLSGITIPLAVLGLVGMVLEQRDAVLTFATVAVLAAVAYVLARSTHTKLAGVAAVLACAALPYWGLGTEAPSTSPTAEISLLVLSVLVAGLCLSVRPLLVVLLCHFGVTAALMFNNSGIPSGAAIEVLGFIGVVSALTVIYAFVRAENLSALQRQSQELLAAATLEAQVLAAEQRAHELADANRQLREAQAQLVQAEKLAALGQLCASVAHELRNPLTTMLMSAELLTHAGSTEAQRDLVAKLERGASRCVAISDNLLQFGRPSTGDKDDVDLSAIAKATAEMAEPQLRMMGANLSLELDESLIVLGNENELAQVMLNLLINAGHAVAEDGAVRVSGARRVDSARLTVSDDGDGLDDEVADQIFEPFFSMRRDGTGTGLGLAVSKQIIEDHGGSIEVDSASGSGASFTIVLPLLVD